MRKIYILLLLLYLCNHSLSAQNTVIDYRLKSFHTGRCEDGLIPENEWRMRYMVNNSNNWSGIKRKDLNCAVWWAGALNILWIYNNEYAIGDQQIVSGNGVTSDPNFNNYVELWEEDWGGDNTYDRDYCILRICPCFGGCCFCIRGSDEARRTWNDPDHGDPGYWPQKIEYASSMPHIWWDGNFERDGFRFGYQYKWRWDGKPNVLFNSSPGIISPLTINGTLARFCPGSSTTYTATHSNFNPNFGISYVWSKRCISNCEPSDNTNWTEIPNQTGSQLTVNYEPVTRKKQFEHSVQLKSHGVLIGQPTTITGLWYFPPGPSLDIIPHHVLCNGELTGKLEYQLSGGTAPYYFNMRNTLGHTENIPSSSIPGTPARYFFENQYAETITGIVESSEDGINAGGGCYTQYPTSVIVTQPPTRPSFTNTQSNFNAFSVHCNGNSDGYIDLNLAGGTPPYKVKIGGSAWQDPSASTTHHFGDLGFSNEASTTLSKSYTVEVTDVHNCTVPSQIVNFTQPSVLTTTGFSKNNFNTYDISCFEYSDGGIQVDAGGGVSALPYTFSASGLVAQSGNPNTSFIDLGLTRYSERISQAAYLYNFTITDANMCSTTTSVVLNSPPRLEVVFPFPDIHGPGCFGRNEGYVIMKANGGVTTTTSNMAGYNYNYSVKNVYTLTTETNTLQTDFAQNNIHFSEVITFNGMSAGGYVYSVSGTNACTFTGGFTITQPNPIMVSTVTGEVTCKGGNDASLNPGISGGTLIPVIGYLFVWKNELLQVLTVTTSTIGGLSVGDYSLRVTDKNGCTNGTGTALRVNEPDQPLQLDPLNTIIHPVDCFGKSTGNVDALAKGGWPATYDYAVPALHITNITGSFRNVPSGSYELVIMDSHGCTVSGMAVVPQPAEMVLTAAKQDVNCNGNDNGLIVATVSGGYGMLKFSNDGYLFSGFQSDNLYAFHQLAPGFYPLSVKDENNCLATLTGITITQPGILLVDALSKDAICGSATGIALYTVTGGTSPYLFDSDVEGETVNAFSYKVDELASGPYQIHIKDAHHCSVTGIAFIRDRNGPLVIGKLRKGTDCSYSADGIAEVRGIAASGKFISGYSWISNRQPLASVTTIVSGLKGGQTITATATDNDGCNGADYIYVISAAELRTQLIPTDPTCNNFNDGNIESIITGGTAPYSYAWDDNQKQTSSTAANLSGGVENNTFRAYHVKVGDIKNCTSSGQAFLLNPEALKIEFSEDSAVVCVGQNVGLDLQNPGLSYQWTKDGEPFSTEQVVTLQDDGAYEATVTNQNGCKVKRKFKLRTSDDVLDARFLLKSEVYAEDTVLLAEVSQPIPTKVEWILPEEFKIIRTESDNREGINDRTYVMIDKEGTYIVGMKATLSSCTDSIKKEVKVLPAKDNPKNLRIGYTGIKSYNVIPNPANLEFTLHIMLTDPQNVEVTIRHAITAHIMEKRSLNELSAEFKTLFDISNYPVGMYFIEATTSGSRRIIKVMKN